MSLLTSAVYPALGDVAAREGRASTYTLTHTGSGWTLLTRRHTGPLPGWSTPLAPHGAGPRVSRRVAQAVGVRVLHELGVEVTGWTPAPGPAGDAGTDVVARTLPRAAPRRPRGLRGH